MHRKNIYLYIKQDFNKRYSVEVKKYTDDGQTDNSFTNNIENMVIKECYKAVTIESMFDINIGNVSEVLGSNLAIGTPFKIVFRVVSATLFYC